MGKYSQGKEIIRFLIGGIANTAFTYVIYLALLKAAQPVTAYTISFCAGIFLGYAINTYYVFQNRWSWKKLCAFPLVHLVNYTIGTTIIWLATKKIGIDSKLAPLLSIIATVPVNYVLSRRIVQRPLAT